MSDFVTTAIANLVINGEPAKRKIQELEAKIQHLNQQKVQLLNSGSTKGVDRINRQIIAAEKQMDKLKYTTEATKAALLKLDKATPMQLQTALRTLKAQLNEVKRGSQEFKEYQKRIQLIQNEIEKVNKTPLQRIGKSFYDFGNAITFAVTAITGLQMIMRKAVNAYAEMEEQVTNTKKYTGMAWQDVRDMNEFFKNMDTRLSRDKLNELAQEAGRLGKNTREAVQGYVEAAQIINVALVDLGEGATQTIAKIANIFGVEQLMGTKEAMLAVGSTVNVLSQNCTASKPYLVEFAQRMSGIGAEAGMTIPQILAFAATLDANGQKVEMSASAISRLIMMLFQKPKEIAKQVGLDVKTFTETLNRSTNEGVIMFLERLKQIGEKDALAALSPLFKDLGMDGIRLSQVLASLAVHLDMVKWEQEEANKAFNEATSATNEFNLFNNTVQAGIDKAKKRLQELTVELGEKLLPVMQSTMTFGSLVVRGLNWIVPILQKLWPIIRAVGAAYIVYAGALAIATARQKALALYHKLFDRQLTIGTRTITANTLALRNLANASHRVGLAWEQIRNKNYRQGLGLLASSFGKVGNAIKAAFNPANIMVVALAIQGVVSIIKMLIPEQNKYVKAIKETADASKNLSKEAVEEQDKLKQLIYQLKYASKESDEYKKAKQTLISQYKNYLNGLIDEKGEVINLTTAYDRLTAAIRRSAEERGIAAAKEKINADYYASVPENQGRLRRAFTAWNKRNNAGFDEESIERAVIETMAMVNNGTIPSKATKDMLGKMDSRFTWGNFRNALNANAVMRWITDLFGTTEKEEKERGFVASDLQPGNVMKDVLNTKNARDQAIADLDKRAEALQPYPGQSTKWLTAMLKGLESALKENGGDKSKIKIGASAIPRERRLGNKKVYDGEYFYDLAVESLQSEIGYRGGAVESGDVSQFTSDQSPYTPRKTKAEIAAEKKAKAAAERERKRKEMKEKKEFKEGKRSIEAAWETADAENTAKRIAGEIDYRQWENKKDELKEQYLEDLLIYLKNHGLGPDEEHEVEADELYADTEKKLQDHLQKMSDKKRKYATQEIELDYKLAKRALEIEKITPESRLYGDELAQMERAYEIEVNYLEKMRDNQEKTSKEWVEWDGKLQEEHEKNKLAMQQYLEKGYQKWLTEFSTEGAQQRYENAVKLIAMLHAKELMSPEEYKAALARLNAEYAEETAGTEEYRSPEQKRELLDKQEKAELAALEAKRRNGEIASEEEFERLKYLIWKKYRDKREEDARNSNSKELNMLLDLVDAWQDLFDKLNGGAGDWFGTIDGVITATAAVVSAVGESMTSLIKANADYEVAVAEKKYQKIADMAEGNKYKEKKAEKEKEKEVSAIKRKAAKAEFTTKVLTAVADTASNAIRAYGAGLQIGGMAGLIMAPIAAAMAVAAGAVQIAVIKKQKETQEVQGYAEGGFTKKGKVDEVAGVVHAGEWVASQRLVNNPTTRPIIEALDYAQRNNRIGSITPADVSTSVTAATRQAVSSPTVTVQPMYDDERIKRIVETQGELSRAIDRLNNRLNEPFVTVNTVTGDYGMQKAQEEYQRLINNKSSKSRRI